MLKIIPRPNNLTEFGGKLSLDLSCLTYYCDQIFSQFDEVAPSIWGKSVRKEQKEECAKLLVKFDGTHKREHYTLRIDESNITISASEHSGAIYALVTLKQIVNCCEDAVLPTLEIKKDAPKYSWRGLQLDESRHFFGKDTVKKFLDFMLLYKLNIFHWHLTDDQGWRIEIDKYPLLTEIGSKRKGTQIGNWKSKEIDFTEHGGFYTKDDIREILAYAKLRGIEVVPEIDFPAHCASAIAAYNYLACREISCEVPHFFDGIIAEDLGIKNWNRTLCLSKDSVTEFVFNVIDEVCELFPSKYFHVGGDEAPITEWKECPGCQQKIKDLGLKNERDLQAHFINEVNEHLKTKGKVLLGWNEILASKLIDTDIIAQYWTAKADKNVTRHLKNGGKVIMSCHKNFYYDMLYTYCTLKAGYKFKLTKNNVPKALTNNVIGIEGENWTEWSRTEDKLFFSLFPRGLAMAEIAWTQDHNQNYKNFVSRIQPQKKLMDEMKVYYGLDFITMKKSIFKKKRLVKKYGLNIKDYDYEFKLDKKLKQEQGLL